MRLSLLLLTLVAIGCDASALVVSGPIGEGGSSGEVDGGAPTTSTAPPAPRPECGNGLVESGEVCDDGNAVDWDGCDSGCTPSAQWITAHDGAGATEWVAVATFPDGGAVVAGRRVAPGGGAEHDIVVARYDPSGAMAWVTATSANDGRSDDPHDIAVDPAGGIYVAGSRRSIAAPGVESAFVFSLDDDGFARWERTVASAEGRGCVAHGIAVHRGRVAVAASSDDHARWLAFDPETGVLARDELVGVGDGLAVGTHPTNGFAMFHAPATGAGQLARRTDAGAHVWDAPLAAAGAADRAAIGFDATRDRWVALGVRASASRLFEVRDADGAVSPIDLPASRSAEGVAIDAQGFRTWVGSAFDRVRHAFALRQEPNGAIRWEFELNAGPGTSARAYDVATLPAGRAYVAGSAWPANGGARAVLWALNP